MNIKLIALASAIVAALLCVLWIYNEGKDAGEAKLRTNIERGNRAASDKADGGEHDVLACPPELWIRGKGCANKQ